MSGFASKQRDLWLPALVALTGLLLSLGGWGVLIADRRDHLLASARETGADVAQTVEARLEQQTEMLRGLSQLWADYGLRPVAEWRANVDWRVNQVTGLDFVAWVDLDEPRNRIATGEEGSSEDIDLAVEQARLHARHPYLAGPERDATGAAAYRIFLPVRGREDHAGVLVARFRVESALGALLRGRAPGYALSVLWGEQEIFSRGTPSPDRWQAWWRIEEPIALPLGGQWRLVQRPTAELAAARLTPVPHYLLATGILLSLVLAILAHQLRLTARQSRFLAASNRALEERGQELESKVAERTEELQDVIAELEAFNYSVSHDLRSPLGAVLNFSAILEEDYQGRPLDAEGLAVLARIRRSASRATALLEDLLQLSRAGRASLSFERVDMAALAREMFAQVRVAQDDADVELLLEPLPEATGDRALLGDVFCNLFSNALKYSRGREKRRITVSGRVDQGECIYEVVDNGRGFDMRFVHKLFGVFERLDSADEIEGTGVGLAMVARILKRHGGRVWAEGRPGEGARFSFALPRHGSA